MFGFSDLEERLLGADSVAAHAEVAQRLAALRDKLHSAQQAGLPPEGFERSEILNAALNAATVILTAPILQEKN